MTTTDWIIFSTLIIVSVILAFPLMKLVDFLEAKIVGFVKKDRHKHCWLWGGEIVDGDIWADYYECRCGCSKTDYYDSNGDIILEADYTSQENIAILAKEQNFKTMF